MFFKYTFNKNLCTNIEKQKENGNRRLSKAIGQSENQGKSTRETSRQAGQSENYKATSWGTVCRQDLFGTVIGRRP